MVILLSIFVIRTQRIVCDKRSFVSRDKETCKKYRRNDANTLEEIFVTNLLNNKTIILLNLAE